VGLFDLLSQQKFEIVFLILVEFLHNVQKSIYFFYLLAAEFFLLCFEGSEISKKWYESSYFLSWLSSFSSFELKAFTICTIFWPL